MAKTVGSTGASRSERQRKGEGKAHGRKRREERGWRASQAEAGNQAGRAGVGEPKFRFRSGELN